jgi:hypothetical protein
MGRCPAIVLPGRGSHKPGSVKIGAMPTTKNPVVAAIWRWAGDLRFPWLFGLTAVLFLLDMVVPDFLPFIDEILLGLAALLLGTWRKRKIGISEGEERAD